MNGELETRNASTWKLLINNRHSALQLYDIISYVVYTRISKRVIWIYGRGVSRKEVQSYIDIAIIKQIDSNCILDKCALLWVINRL